MIALRTTLPAPVVATAAASATAAPDAAGAPRETYDAGGVELPDGELGKLVRDEASAASGDVPVDAAHDHAGIVRDFLRDVLGRDSIDGAGMVLQSTAHYGKGYNNAFWNGSSMTYGDGDGKTFSPLSQSLDVVGHEMMHGVTERTAGLRYEQQSGTLNESFSDVFGELMEQWAGDRDSFGTPDAAKAADWLVGEDTFTPGTAGDALRSMKAPGTAYPKDPQPAHMDQYVETTQDNGGVHINSGIPNKAAYEAALRIGGEKLAKIWYSALTERLQADATFQDAANATVDAAIALYQDGTEAQAIRDAWTSVGLVPGAAAPDQPKQPAPPAPSNVPNPGVVPPWFRPDRVIPTFERAPRAGEVVTV